MGALRVLSAVGAVGAVGAVRVLSAVGAVGALRVLRALVGTAFATGVAGTMVVARVPAQSRLVSPDQVYLRREAPHFAKGFGADPFARMQFVDGNLRGIHVQLTEIAFRLDYRQHNPQTAAARSWAQVELFVGEGDLATFGSSFVGNWQALPTRVFQGAVRWPAVAGVPTTFPAAWGGDTGAYRFPFAAPSATPRLRDLLLEFSFYGGSLLGQTAGWRDSTPYYLDSYRAGDAVDGTETRFGRYFLTGGCADSGVNNTLGAFGMLSTSTHGPAAPVHKNSFELSYKAHRLGADAPTLTVLGLGLDRVGQQYPGLTCNRFHVDQAAPFTVFVGRADNIGSLPLMHFGLPDYGVFAYAEALAGTPLVAQTAWHDTRTGALRLTAASFNSLMAANPFAAPAGARRKTLRAADTTSLIGIVSIGDPAFDPVCGLLTR